MYQQLAAAPLLGKMMDSQLKAMDPTGSRKEYKAEDVPTNIEVCGRAENTHVSMWWGKEFSPPSCDCEWITFACFMTCCNPACAIPCGPCRHNCTYYPCCPCGYSEICTNSGVTKADYQEKRGKQWIILQNLHKDNKDPDKVSSAWSVDRFGTVSEWIKLMMEILETDKKTDNILTYKEMNNVLRGSFKIMSDKWESCLRDPAKFTGVTTVVGEVATFKADADKRTTRGSVQKTPASDVIPGPSSAHADAIAPPVSRGFGFCPNCATARTGPQATAAFCGKCAYQFTN